MHNKANMRHMLPSRSLHTIALWLINYTLDGDRGKPNCSRSVREGACAWTRTRDLVDCKSNVLTTVPPNVSENHKLHLVVPREYATGTKQTYRASILLASRIVELILALDTIQLPNVTSYEAVQISPATIQH